MKIENSFIIFFFAALAMLAPLPALASTIGLPPNNLGLVGYWSFNEGNGTIAHDFSGNGNNGTLSGSPAPTWTSGKFGNGLRFNGSNYTGTSNNIVTGLAASVSFWMKHPPVSAYMSYGVLTELSTNFNSNNAFYISFDDNSGGSVPTMGGILAGNNSPAGYAIYSTNNRYDDGKWHHVVVVFDRTQSTAAAQTTIYVDGTSAAKTQVAGYNTLQSTPFGSYPFFIGDRSGTTYGFDNAIDDVRIYNRALSATEIAALYQSGAARMGVSQSPGTLSQGLVGWWTMDGKDTVWSSGTAGTETDESGQGRTGTLNGFTRGTSQVTGKIGQALQFNNNYISTANVAVNTAAGAQNTVTFWMRWDGTDSIMPFGWLLYDLWLHSGCFGFNTANSDILGVSSAGFTNNWVFVSAVFYNGVPSATNNALYINGAKQTITQCLSTPVSQSVTTSPQISGWTHDTGYQFHGPIDDVRIYNRPLSAGEIKELYDLGQGTHMSTSQPLQNGSSLASGLVGYWTFDGPTINWATGIASDSSGQGNSGQLVGMSTTTSPVTGKMGQALQFGSGNSYVLAPNSASLNSGTVTATAWIKIGPACSSLWKKVLGKGPDATEVYGLYITPNNCAFHVEREINGAQASIDPTSPVSLNDNKWHLVTYTYDGSNEHLYVDGVSVVTNAITGSLATSSENVSVGVEKSSSTDQYYFPGTIDDVRIYNRALSASEVKQLYNMGR